MYINPECIEGEELQAVPIINSTAGLQTRAQQQLWVSLANFQLVCSYYFSQVDFWSGGDLGLGQA